MEKSIIEFKDFSFCYNAQKDSTLKNINLSIKKGEKIAIIGPSGSGKSTMGHCINALIPFYYEGKITGSLKIKDLEIKNIHTNSKIVGSILQDQNAQFVGLSVEEDIAFSLENDNIETSKMKEKVFEISKKVSIDHLLKSNPHELSGGQKQKVSLAGVMVNNVEILLFDEPLANLDPASSKIAIELIDKLHKENNLTTIIIEHRLEEVLHCDIDRVIVMDEGEILYIKTPDELLKSTILKELKIREPLYISALKYAGCDIYKIENIDKISKIDFLKFSKELTLFSKTYPYILENKNKKILELKNIEFGYNEDLIIKNLNLEIYEKEMISLVGNNGAGKSTLSKIICGFEKIKNGDIIFDSKSIKDKGIAKIAENIGFVLQDPNAMICKNIVKEEIEMGIINNPNKEEIIDNVLEVCGLKPFKNWPISALSYGQKKRVTIASILALSPKILILDEPTAGQDLYHYQEIMKFLKKINKLGITIIFITHDMHLMVEYTNRTLVIHDGKIIANDIPSRILDDENLVLKSSLSKTSLHLIAKQLNVNIDDFINSFINYEVNYG